MAKNYTTTPSNTLTMSLRESPDDDSEGLRARVRRIIDEDRTLFDELDE